MSQNSIPHIGRLALVETLQVFSIDANIWYMEVSQDIGTPKSSILVGFSIINRPLEVTPIPGNPHINVYNINNYHIYNI